SLTMSYDECSDGVVLLLPIVIDSGIRRFKNSIYNLFAEILVYNNLEAVLTTKTSDKIEKNNKILKKFITRANKSIDYNTISTEDYRWVRELLFEFTKVRIKRRRFIQSKASKIRIN
ncbi:hypothetical protein OFC13_26150, partial [Escherichia coli]|nr:hypothetical protein [Escherichia coli]